MDRAIAQASEPSDGPQITDPVYPVSAFNIRFDRDVSSIGLDADDLLNQPVRLSRVGEVFTGVQPGAQTIEATLAQLDDGQVQRYDVTALRAVIDDLLAFLTDELAQTWMERKTGDLERWLRGMRRLQAKIDGGQVQ